MTTYPYSVEFALQLIRKADCIFFRLYQENDSNQAFLPWPHTVSGTCVLCYPSASGLAQPSGWFTLFEFQPKKKKISRISPSFPLCIPPYPSPCCHISQQLLFKLAYAQSLAEHNWCAGYGVHHAIITSGIFAMIFGTCYGLSFQGDFRKQESPLCRGCTEVKQPFCSSSLNIVPPTLSDNPQEEFGLVDP